MQPGQDLYLGDNLSLPWNHGVQCFSIHFQFPWRYLYVKQTRAKIYSSSYLNKILTKLGQNPTSRHSLPPPPNCPSRHKTSSWAIESYIYIYMTFRKIEDWKLHIQVQPVIRDNEIQSEEKNSDNIKETQTSPSDPKYRLYQKANSFRIHHKCKHGFLLTSIKTCFLCNCALCQKHLELTYLKYNLKVLPSIFFFFFYSRRAEP